jgi:hypothetical protein
MAIVFLAGLLWLVFGVLRPRAGHSTHEQASETEEANLAAAENVRR